MKLLKEIICKLLGKNKTTNMPNVEVSQRTRDIVMAFGGIQNITGFNVGAVSLRYDVNDTNLVNSAKLKDLGATEVSIIEPRYVEAKFGEEADKINNDIKIAIQKLKHEASKSGTSQKASYEQSVINKEKENNIEEDLDEISISLPAEGEILPLESLNDGVFSDKMLGEGFVVDIKGKKQVDVFAPVDGILTVVFPSKHAYGISGPCGLQILIHIGIDTVKLGGIGFTSYVNVNEQVKKGQKLVTLDVSRIEQDGYNPNIIVVVTPDSKLLKIKQYDEKTFLVSK